MNNPWRTELWFLGLVTVVGLTTGYVFGYPLLGVTIGTCAYLVWHLQNLVRLVHCLQGGDTHTLSDSKGAWGYVFGRLNATKSANEKEKKKLRRSRDRYRSVTRALPEAAVTLKAEGQIDMINEAAVRLLGLRDPEDLGQPITSFIRDPKFIELLDEGQSTQAIEVVSPANESSKLSLRVVPYGGSKKRLLLAQDVTRLNRLEQVRRDFIANISHELKSPLTVIIGYVESLQDDQESARKWSKPLAQIEQQSNRMRRIVEDLLQLSALETTEVTDDVSPVDVPALIRSICNEARELGGEDNYSFSVDVDDELMLLGNFNELYSAFSNIVFNAIRYTPGGGDIKLRWYEDNHGKAKFEVEDNGIGIAPQHIKRLTERFYRIDKGRSRLLGGTGLGLAIVKHVLIRHNAKLNITSTPGTGSTFTCEFSPLRIAKSEKAKSA